IAKAAAASAAPNNLSPKVWPGQVTKKRPEIQMFHVTVMMMTAATISISAYNSVTHVFRQPGIAASFFGRKTRRVTKKVGRVLNKMTARTGRAFGAWLKAAATNEAPRMHKLRCRHTQATYKHPP